jgi:hypothetical protein
MSILRASMSSAISSEEGAGHICSSETMGSRAQRCDVVDIFFPPADMLQVLSID